MHQVSQIHNNMKSDDQVAAYVWCFCLVGHCAGHVLFNMAVKIKLRFYHYYLNAANKKNVVKE